MTKEDRKNFTESINISSNIKANKNAIIGKFDIKDIFFILVAFVIGIVVLSVLLVFLSIRNMFIILIVLAIFEIPIITVGFLKLYDIEVLDYIKMKNKSDNKSYRKQMVRKKPNNGDKYLISILIDRANNKSDIDFSKLEEIINILYTLLHYKKMMIKVIYGKLILVVEIAEGIEIDYSKLFDYLRVSKEIKYISTEDIKNYETYIKSLKFENKKYNNKQNKDIKQKKDKLSKIEVESLTNEKNGSILEEILLNKEVEYLKVLKITLYKSPFNLNIINEIKEKCNIVSHISIDIYSNEKVDEEMGKTKKINYSELSFVDTFIEIEGSEEEIKNRYNEVREILEKEEVLYKEIREEKVRESMSFIMENRY